MDQLNLSSLISGGKLPEAKTGKRGLGEFLSGGQKKPSTDGLLDHDQIGTSLRTEVRSQMSQFTAFKKERGHSASDVASAVSKIGAGAFLGPALPHHLASLVPLFVNLMTRARQELEQNLSKLLSLNPSRREAVAAHLDRLGGGAIDAAGGLRRWIEGPKTPAQAAALRLYFDEVALIALGQAILLKAWSDRGVKPWNKDDLGRLNWALSSALKPHVPLDREGWQITRPNLYSWYNPSAELQREIWSALENYRFKDEGPGVLAGLLRHAAATVQNDSGSLGARGSLGTPASSAQGYDARFFAAIWEHLQELGFSGEVEYGGIRRKRIIFSPTLRDGLMVRTGPLSAQWIGLESQPFLLLIAEIIQLWWGPASPPIWAVGSGLEVHSRDQLQLQLNSPKPSILSRITEMEACDLAFVLEEKTVRCSGRNPEANRLRELLDPMPYFKKLRSATTSLGALQACVALSKIRPGGLLWWAREEPLCENEGKEVLGFMLDRAKVLMEWDLSEIKHHLPHSQPLYPRFLYLLQRESDLQARLEHRPGRITVHGQIRSHVEVPLFLQDALQARVRESAPRGNWKIHRHSSPSAQKEWAERWPDPAGHDVLLAIENLRAISSPLAAAVTIRPTPAGDPARENAWMVNPSLRGFWIRATHEGDKRKLAVQSLPKPGMEARGHGFLILAPDESWVTPLMAYLESEAVASWLEHTAERKSEKWVLTEQVVKFIPVPKTLLQILHGARDEFAAPLPGEWEKLASELVEEPKRVLDRVRLLDDSSEALLIRAALFVRVSRSLDQIRRDQGRFLSLIGKEGKIHWEKILDILPRSECVPITLHSNVRISGALPPHLPIGRFDRIKAPVPGILLSTENGFNLTIHSESRMLLEIIDAQLQGMTSPTWSELAQALRLPRRAEVAETTANDVLRCHTELSARVEQIGDLLRECSRFIKSPSGSQDPADHPHP